MTMYGDRLVFSNGIIVLAGFAALLVVMFQASVTHLIPLYAIGVFTSFTFSQAGMAKRHTKLHEKGWRAGFVINGFGGIVSGVMTVIIAATKFKDGAWIILLAVPMLLMVLRDQPSLQGCGEEPPERGASSAAGSRTQPCCAARRPAERGGAASVRLRGADRERVVQVRARCGAGRPTGYRGRVDPRGRSPRFDSNTRDRSERRGPGLARDPQICGRCPDAAPVNRLRYRRRFRTGRTRVEPLLREPYGIGHQDALLFANDVVVTDVPYIVDAEQVSLEPGTGAAHEVVLLVSGVHNASLHALEYCRSLAASSVRAVHVSIEPHETERLVADWGSWEPGLPLDVIESPYRDIGGPLLDYVRQRTDGRQTIVTVVMPEFIVKKWWHHALHNQTALVLKRAFLSEPDVVVTSVPYRLQ